VRLMGGRGDVVGRSWVRAFFVLSLVASPVGAAVHVDVVVGVDAAGRLTASPGAPSFPVPPSWVAGLPGYAGTTPVGFRSVEASAATDALRPLDPGAHIAFELLYTGPGLAVIDAQAGAPVRRGDLVKLGTAPFDAHPLWALAADVRGARTAQLRLIDRARIHDPGSVLTLTFVPEPNAEAWLCPMRCEGDKAYDAPGPCPHCGAPRSLAMVERYEADITTVPRSLQVETPARLGITLRDPKGASVTLDEGALDTYVVAADLSSFAYGRPSRDPDGTFQLPATFTTAGLYTVFLELTAPRAGVQVTSSDVLVAGPTRERVRLVADATNTVTAEGYAIAFEADGPLIPLHEMTCRFAVTRNGAPVGRLAPVRGAPGQLVIVGENRGSFLHRAARKDGTPGSASSAATFRCVFPKPGLHRMWVQLAPDDKPLTVSFTVRVVRGDAVRSRRSSADEEGVEGVVEPVGDDGGEGGDGGGE
jgi:hypothetical protein